MKNSCFFIFGIIACIGLGVTAYLFAKENRQRTMFDFTETTLPVPVDAGTITARLSGTWQYVSEKPQISHRKSPYHRQAHGK